MSYVEINQAGFEYILNHLGKSGYSWRVCDEPNAKEKIYMVSINDIHVKVFSSVVGGVSRRVGADAIRVVGWDITSDRPIMSSEMRVNRTNNWANHLRTRIDNVVTKLIDSQKCEICGGMKVKIKGKFGEFIGCLNYKNHGAELKNIVTEKNKEF